MPSTASATDFRTFPRDMKKGLTITRKPFIYNEFLVGSASFERAHDINPTQRSNRQHRDRAAGVGWPNALPRADIRSHCPKFAPILSRGELISGRD